MTKQRKPLIDETGEARELTKEDFARMVPFEQLPEEVKRSLATRRHRGPQKAPTKERVTLRLSPEVVEHFKAGGRGWQTRIDEKLLEIVSSKGRRTRQPIKRTSARRTKRAA